MYIIGIAGGTASGKTTVVKEIVNSLPEGSVAVIPQDSYYKDSSHVPIEGVGVVEVYELTLLNRDMTAVLVI